PCTRLLMRAAGRHVVHLLHVGSRMHQIFLKECGWRNAVMRRNISWCTATQARLYRTHEKRAHEL
ncbi:MAG: hypothetical protein AAFQ35_14560, partial [Pseudomonadota bacterium]